MAKSKMPTPEEKREFDRREIIRRSEFIPDPTYTFNVGDRAGIGNLEDVIVIDKINDKVYELDYSYTDTNYGNPIKHEHQRRFANWLEIRPICNSNTTLIKNEDLHLSYSQRTMVGLLSMVYSFGMNFDPEYQRGYVWDKDDKIALIDSIYNCVDIGKFVVIHKAYTDKYLYEILDGKQRLRAICDYYENRFSYNGKFYNDLSAKERHHFKDYPIAVAEVDNVTEEQVLRYFIMVNKHGKIMSKEQIEKVEKMLEEKLNNEL